MASTHPRHRLLAVAGSLCVLALFAAACGSKKSDNAGGTTPATGASSNVTVADSGQPTPGGTLTFGLEAETDGWNPTINRWAISGTEVGLAVYDPLVAFDADNKPQPYLAQSITPNADYTQWTFVMRPGITFHDGSALTGKTIETMFKAHLQSPLTKPVLAPIKDVTSSGDTAVITMKAPWVAFPASLTSQLGMVPAPSMFNPDGSPTDAGKQHPVGTGPFVFKNWTPDNIFSATKNPNYWRKGLPYLDEIDFKPIPDYTARDSAMLSGGIQEMHTSSPASLVEMRKAAKDNKVQIVEDKGEGQEKEFLIVNTQDPVVGDVRVRQAMAYATDRDTYNAVANKGIVEDANGPFKPSSKWYTATDYPSFNLDKAKELVAAYKADKGQAPSFTLGTTNSPDNQQAVAQLQEMYKAAGMNVEIKISEQSAFITDAVLGGYQVNLWRQFGAADPDADALWWYSANAGDGAKGGLTLNIARYKSATVDAGLDKGRTSTDDAVRKEGYAALQKDWATNVPYVWLARTIWAVIAAPNVRGIANGPLPDGQASLPIGGAGDFGGVVRFTQTWLQK